MILEHEIPKGSKLYFEKSAALKRDIETKAVSIFKDHGFEEIVTPTFSYLQHQDIGINDRELLKLSNEHNFTIVLRNDSTIDVTRIITKRLGRSTNHKRWFYIQPVFSYPTIETNQIGAEYIDSGDIRGTCELLIEIIEEIGIKPKLQISNVQIPLTISRELNIPLEVFLKGELEKIFASDLIWLKELLRATSLEELKNIKTPAFLKEHLFRLIELGEGLKYKNIIPSPLFYPPMRYYSDLFFRMFEENKIVALGGKYESEEIKSSGFAIYTDSIIDIFSKNYTLKAES